LLGLSSLPCSWRGRPSQRPGRSHVQYPGAAGGIFALVKPSGLPGPATVAGREAAGWPAGIRASHWMPASRRRCAGRVLEWAAGRLLYQGRPSAMGRRRTVRTARERVERPHREHVLGAARSIAGPPMFDGFRSLLPVHGPDRPPWPQNGIRGSRTNQVLTQGNGLGRAMVA